MVRWYVRTLPRAHGASDAAAWSALRAHTAAWRLWCRLSLERDISGAPLASLAVARDALELRQLLQRVSNRLTICNNRLDL